MRNNRQLKMQHGRRISDVTELEIMLSGMSEERKKRIRDKADRLEVFFKDEVVYMKDKDEGWKLMLSEDDVTYYENSVYETTNNKGNK